MFADDQDDWLDLTEEEKAQSKQQHRDYLVQEILRSNHLVKTTMFKASDSLNYFNPNYLVFELILDE